MEDAVEGVTRSMGMSVCDKSNTINVTDKVHNILLSGLFLGKEMVLTRGMIGFNTEYGCVLKVCIRSLSQNVSKAMADCV
jgi:coatomer protein complex subunit gamma